MHMLRNWPLAQEKLLGLMKENIRDKKFSQILKEYENPDSTASELFFQICQCMLNQINMLVIYLAGGRDVILLACLPCLCRPSPIRKKGKSIWRPTLLESLQGFILHVKVCYKFIILKLLF